MMTMRKPRKLVSLIVMLLITTLAGLGYYTQNVKKQPIILLGEKPKWVFRADESILSCAPNNDTGVFVHTTNAIYLIDSVSGDLIWKTNIDEATNTYLKYITRIGIKSNGEILIVPRDNGEVFSMATNNGELLWHDLSTTKAPVFDIDIDQDHAYITRSSLSISAISLRSGNRVWSNPVPDRTALYIFSINEKVYLGTGYVLFVYDAQTGELLFEQKLDGLMGRMFLDDKNIYIVFTDGKYSVVSLTTDNLSFRWSVPQSLLSFSEVNSLIVENDIIYIAGSKLASLSTLNGEVLWVSNVEDSFGEPLVQNSILLTQGKIQVYTFDKKSGQLLTNQRIPAFFPLVSWMTYTRANPCQSNSMFWIAVEDQLYSYKLPQ